MSLEKSQKNLPNFFCEKCSYVSSKKCDFNKHILTLKHKKLVNASKMLVNASKILATSNCRFKCICGKSYSHDSSYYRHKKLCFFSENNVIDDDNMVSTQIKNVNNVTTDKELIMMLIKENSEMRNMMMKVIENGTHNTTNNTTNNTHTNSHNKAFNLNFFLNETCKNAMNITDFVDSIKLQLSDLIDVGELGYIEGISKIIVKNLNNLDETERPIHCTDKKRETMYIKDEGEWNKEDETKTRLKKAITKVADKNIKLLPAFREKYPEYKNSSSKISDKYDKMVIEVMTCDDVKNEKIIKNISKATTIKD